MKLTHTQQTLSGGTTIDLYQMENTNGYRLQAMTLGASVTEFWMPDKQGKSENILLSAPTLDAYEHTRLYYGSIVGPVAGRIEDATFSLQGKKIALEKNEGRHHLHGGTNGWDTQIWRSETECGENEATIWFILDLAEGKDGYPGEYEMRVGYTLTEQNEWTIRYETTAKQETLLNPTNHVYFNLDGQRGSVLNHNLKISSDELFLLNQDLIPTGDVLKIRHTVFDFNEETCIKETVLSDHIQIKYAKGLDHAFLLNKQKEGPQISLHSPQSGRTVQIQTDRDAVVVYTHNHALEELNIEPFQGIALETQMPPNSIHMDKFKEKVILKSHMPFVSETTYLFSLS